MGLLYGRWRGLDICNMSLNFPLWLQGKESTRTLLPDFCSSVICLPVCQNAEYRQHIHAAHQRRLQIKSNLKSCVCFIVRGVLCVCVCVCVSLWRHFLLGSLAITITRKKGISMQIFLSHYLLSSFLCIFFYVLPLLPCFKMFLFL